jgi:ABC-type multidrug transport system fused ATPase/permease subunit
MSTVAVVVIVVAVVVLLALLLVALPRARARSRERALEQRRGEVAGAHRERAEERLVRAEYAEREAQRERAEAELHESRARLHEHGLADDELDTERERLADAPPSGDGAGDDLAARDPAERP